MWYEPVIDNWLLPNALMRLLVKLSIIKYARKISRLNADQIESIRSIFRNKCTTGHLAINTDEANLQHYEVPTEFFKTILGTRMKYSGSYWNDNCQDLDDADDKTLATYESRADIHNDQKILDIGAGWGSMSLYLAEKYHDSQVTSVTNSSTQKEYIESVSNKRNIENLRVIKCDINKLDITNKFDRIISIEMFEHTRNTKQLMGNVSNWLNPNGKLFIQVFSHKTHPHMFDDIEHSWLSRHFFTGGMMPYDGFYKDIPSPLSMIKSWTESGINYHLTLEAWLTTLESNKSNLVRKIQKSNHPTHPVVLINRYKLFLLACSELFKYNEGNDWHLMNYLFKNQDI